MPIPNQVLGPFLGRVGSLDPRFIPDNAAAELSNVTIENGAILPRRGFRTVLAAASGLSAVFSLDYVLGFKTDGTQKEEFLTVETHSGATHLYAVDPATWTKVEVKNGVTSVAMQASDWRALAIDANAYLINPDAVSVMKHAIGDATSLQAMTVPAKPNGPMTNSIDLNPNFPSYASTTVTVSGVATAHAAAGVSLLITHTAADSSHTNTQQGLGPAGFNVDLNGSTAGIQNWQNQDRIEFLLATPGGAFKIDPGSLVVTVINNAGTPITLTPTVTRVDVFGVGGLRVGLYFDDKVRTDFTSIRHLVFAYNVIGCSVTNTLNTLRLDPLFLDGIDTMAAWPVSQDFLTFGYTQYNSTTLEEGPMVTLNVARSFFDSPRANPAAFADAVSFGQVPAVQLRLGGTPDAGVDKWRIYYTATDQNFYRIGEQIVATTTFDVYVADSDARIAGNLYEAGNFKSDQALSGAIVKNSWMVIGYKGGGQNVRHSGVGTPEIQADTTLAADILTQGASFSLKGDDPLAIHEAGDGVIILGAYGAYYQVGFSPITMGPVKLQPSSKGTCGSFASTRWRDDRGNPSVVWVDPAGEVWMGSMSQQLNGDTGLTLTEVSQADRGLLKSLADEQSVSLSTVRVAVDEYTDSLRIIVGKIVMLLRRPSLIDDQRQWEVYRYNMSGTIAYEAFSVRRGMVAARSTGELDEYERNSASALAPIDGSAKDAGSAMPSGKTFWRSKEISGARRGVRRARLERAAMTDTPTLKVISDAQTDTLTFASGQRFVKFGPLQNGRSHQFEIQLPDTCSAITVLDVEQTLLGRSANT